MKELHFGYEMKLDFCPEVQNHSFTFKCIPQSNIRQKVLELKWEVSPCESLSTGQDSFGNRLLYGHQKATHTEMKLWLQGIVQTGLAAREMAEDPVSVGYYRYQTAYTRPGPALLAYADTLKHIACENHLDYACAVMKALHQSYGYCPGITGTRTTAEQAWEQGQGVCQDYAQIMLSLLRMQKIPCRYVVGLLEGEGQSHAWVEVWSEGFWYALDPTNLLIVDDQHICISVGRDFGDCSINRGIFHGSTRQTQTTWAVVCERIG